jgi:beta-glucosidase
MATLGYEEGRHAPGIKRPTAGLRVAHHLLLSHGWATEAIPANVRQPRMGIVLNLCPAYPASQSDDDQEAARWFDGFFNRWYLDPLFKGAYPADAVADRVARGQLAADMPFVHEGDLAAIGSPLDYLGINYYSRAVMTMDENGQPTSVPGAPRGELTAMGWEVFPQGLTDILLRVHEEYAPPSIYITENGAAFRDPPAENGRIADDRRRRYLQEHLVAARSAMAAGVPLRGYFAWSLLDNFEWGHGFTKRFGLFRVDFDTFERHAKDSAYFFRDVVAAGAVSDVITPTSQGETRGQDT